MTRSNTVSVLLGNGNGTFQAQQTFATGNGPQSVAVGDVNGDGKPDLVVAKCGQQHGERSAERGQRQLHRPGLHHRHHRAFRAVDQPRTSPSARTTNASSVSYTVTFSEPVTGVDPADFQLANRHRRTDAVGQVTPVSGAVYTVTVSGITGRHAGSEPGGQRQHPRPGRQSAHAAERAGRVPGQRQTFATGQWANVGGGGRCERRRHTRPRRGQLRPATR